MQQRVRKLGPVFSGSVLSAKPIKLLFLVMVFLDKGMAVVGVAQLAQQAACHLWRFSQVLRKHHQVYQCLNMIAVLLNGLLQERFSFLVLSLSDVGGRLTVQQQRRAGVLFSQLLVDVEGLLKLLSANVQVDPSLCQLRQRSVIIFLLHPLQLLPGQIQSIQFQEALQSERGTLQRVRLVENSQGSLIVLLVIVYGGCDEGKDHVVDVHALCHALVQFPRHLVLASSVS
uniref:Putative secreted protein n=1 Tax=Ixodes ricinus TaxID=34613 RepID=A0A6B0V412_IXORI